MLFPDEVYISDVEESVRPCWVKAPTCRAELTPLAHTTAHRVRRLLERLGESERDVENIYLASDTVDDDPLNQLLRSSIA